jgi:hypothetical protein
MSDYTKTTDFTVKDGLTTGDPDKLVLGSELDAEFTAIAAAIATKTDGNGSVADGDKGDIDVSDSGLTWYVQKADVNYATSGPLSSNYGSSEMTLGWDTPYVDPADMAAWSEVEYEVLGKLYNNTGSSRTFTMKSYYRTAAGVTTATGASLAVEIPTGNYLLLRTLVRYQYVSATSANIITEFDPLPYIGGAASATARQIHLATVADVAWLTASLAGKVTIQPSVNSASLTFQCIWARLRSRRAS